MEGLENQGTRSGLAADIGEPVTLWCPYCVFEWGNKVFGVLEMSAESADGDGDGRDGGFSGALEALERHPR
jgi:hypothetical protein